MEIIKENREDVLVFRLVGSLDGNTAQKVQDEIVPSITKNVKIVIDMAECGYVSSAGLRVLLITAKKLKLENGKGILAEVIEEVKDVMEMTGFSHLLETESTLEEAIKKLKS